jgi:hypothetical protein
MPVINQRQLVYDIPQIGQSIYMNSSIDVNLCWIKKMILEKTEVLFATENNLYL